MKFILSALMLLSVATLYAQEDMRIILSAKKEKLSIKLDEDNSNKVFIIKSANADANYFTATILNEVINEDWKRTFSIHNNADSEIAVLSNTDINKYCISLKDLTAKLKSENEYYLYTIALPTDPKKAMLVKVARNLICKIIIED